jgi:hypothetical protein
MLSILQATVHNSRCPWTQIPTVSDGKQMPHLSMSQLVRYPNSALCANFCDISEANCAARDDAVPGFRPNHQNASLHPDGHMVRDSVRFDRKGMESKFGEKNC